MGKLTLNARRWAEGDDDQNGNEEPSPKNVVAFSSVVEVLFIPVSTETWQQGDKHTCED